MSSVVAPCITVETEAEYKAYVQTITPFAQRVHIDISDGEFAPVLLLNPDKIWWPQNWTVDIHAMVMHPEDYVDQLIALKPHLIIFHAEAQGDLKGVINRVRQTGIRVGIALLKPTVPSTVKDLIELVDHVLVFSGDLGHYGGKASMMQLEKVRILRGLRPNVEIGWDGGVSIENAFSLAQGGVNVLNSGGAIAKAPDPAKTYAALVSEANKQGIF